MIKNFQTKNLTLYSTPDTIAARQVSLLALAETIAATVIYIALTIHWGSYTLYASAILLALPALIRSEASIKTGVRWFLAYIIHETDIPLTSPKGLAILLMSAACAGAVTYLLASNYLSGESGLILFGGAVLLGWIAINLAIMTVVAGALTGALALALALALAGAVTATATVTAAGAIAAAGALTAAVAIALAVEAATAGAAALFLPGLALGFALRALATRICASAFHLKPGIKSIPRNWLRSTAMSDLADLPELVPEASKEDPKLGLSGSLSDLRTVTDPKGRAVNYVLLPYLFLPPILYRWSLKATWWFWLPLAYLAAAPLGSEQASHRRDWILYRSRRAEHIGALVAALTLITAVVFVLDPIKVLTVLGATKDGDATLSIFTFAYAINWSAIRPHVYLAAIPAILTLILYMRLDADERRLAADPSYADTPALKRTTFFNHARTLFTLIALAYALWKFLLFTHAQCDLTAWLSPLGWLFDHIQTTTCPGTGLSNQALP